MQYEVENKYPIADPSAFERRLAALAVDLSPPLRQVDTYFAHPARDFAVTDEALRIRCVGDANFVTYKGPKIDKTTKTRREVELAIEPGERGAKMASEILHSLGFRIVAEVSKRRRSFAIERGGTTVQGMMDDVEHLGAFVELEIVAGEGRLDEARALLTRLADELGLVRSERRSYLELLLEGGA